MRKDYKYAMTQWVVGNESLETTCKRLAKFGYDGIEFASEPNKLDYNYCNELLEKYNLKCHSLCGIFNESRDLSSMGESGKNAVKYLKDSIDFAVNVGASVVICVPSPVGRTQKPKELSYQNLWDNAVNNLKEAGIYAQEKGVKIAIEPINRYETFFINTVDDAYKLACDVDLSSVGIMADLFHMNIEESDMSCAIKRVKDKLFHVHVADSNRQPAGYGHTDFLPILKTLEEVNYQGTLTAEFMYKLSDPYSAENLETQGDLMEIYTKQNLEYLKKLLR